MKNPKRQSRIDEHFAPLEREHQEATRRELLRQGVDKFEDLVTTNTGAYDDIGREIIAVRREQPRLSLVDCLRIARARVEARHSTGGEPIEKPQSEKTKAELDREHLGNTSVEGIMATDHRAHAGGGGGNRSRIVTFRFCATCEAQWARRVEKRDGKMVAVHTKVCHCASSIYISRPESQQLMGAKSAGGGGGGRGRARKKPLKSFRQRCINGHPQTQDVEVCTDCGSAIDKTQDSRSYLLQPALAQFVRTSKSRGLRLSDIILFLTCTPYFTRDQLDSVSSEIESNKLRGTRDKPGRGNPEKLFGEWAGIRESDRLLLSVEMAIERLGVRLKEEPNAEGAARRTPIELRQPQPTHRDVGNLACAVYLEHLQLLRGTNFGIVPNTEIPEIGIEALVTSDPDECLAICDMIAGGDPRLKLLHPYRENEVTPEAIRLSRLDEGPHSSGQQRLASPLQRLCAEMEKRKAAIKKRARQKQRREELRSKTLPIKGRAYRKLLKRDAGSDASNLRLIDGPRDIISLQR